MSVTVTATSWRYELHPAEGFVSIDDKPRTFKTRFGAALYIAGMTAADAKRARQTGEPSRTKYTIIEDQDQ